MDDAALEGLSFAPLDGDGPGWARYFSPEMRTSNLVVLMRIGFPRNHEPGSWDDRSSPLVIREIQLAAGEITATFLRKLPIERIGLAVNHPMHHRQLSRYVNRMTFVSVPPSGLWRDSLPEIPRPENPDLEIAVPGDVRKRRPDEFYYKVADAYLWLAARSQSPARDLASKNNVPVTTVHRWVKEARARGLLPPAIGRGAGKRAASQPDPSRMRPDGRLPYALGYGPDD